MPSAAVTTADTADTRGTTASRTPTIVQLTVTQTAVTQTTVALTTATSTADTQGPATASTA
jgi:hypothetical protein